MPKTKKTETKNEFETKEEQQQINTYLQVKKKGLFFNGVKINFETLAKVAKSKIQEGYVVSDNTLFSISMIKDRKDYHLTFKLCSNMTIGFNFNMPAIMCCYDGGEQKLHEMHMTLKYEPINFNSDDIVDELKDIFTRVLSMFYSCEVCGKICPFEKCAKCGLKDVVDTSEIEADICLICREKLIQGNNNYPKKDCCEQIYHAECRTKLTKCPICRKPIDKYDEQKLRYNLCIDYDINEEDSDNDD